MADHSKPTTTSTYTNFVSEIDGRLDDLALGLDPATTSPTNVPTNAIRWNSASKKWEQWSGSAWADLSSEYAINLSAGAVISGSTSSDALRITQTGTGNALVVEDSANPDSTPFVIDASGQVLVGSPSAISYSNSLVPQLQVNKLGAEQVGISRFSADNGSNAFVFLKSRGTTFSGFDVVSSGDGLGTIGWYGTDGTTGIQAASISAAVDGTPGTNDMPGRLVFSTTADGASSPTERLRIKSTGESWFQANNTTSALTITQTGTGNALVVEDSTNPDSTPFVIDAGGNVGIGTSSPATLFHVSGSSTTAISRIQNTGSGATSFDGSGAGLELLSAGMNLTSKYTPAIKFGSTDPDFTTTNPKFGASIVATAVQTYSTDTSGGMNLEFWTAPGSPGTGSGLVERMRIDSNGTVTLASTSGLSIGRTAVTSPASTDGNVFSGTYTPTLTNTTNVDSSTAAACQYMRVGNVVTVSGRVAIDATTSGVSTELGMSIPVASNFTASNQAGGTFHAGGVNNGGIYADATNDRVTFVYTAGTASNATMYFSFTYQVL